MTLQYYLHRCGLAARRKVDAIIEQGRVAVNGTVVREFWLSVNPDKDSVTVDGAPCHLPLGHHYYLFHKPRGLITSVSDPRGRQTVIDYVRKVHGLSEPLHPTGRLDKDTEGLLILTDDGDFTQKITHPSHEIPKVYVAVLKNEITDEQKRILESGIQIDGAMTAKAKLAKVRLEKKGLEGQPCWRITIHEGKKRQVRRMFEAVGTRVMYLRRDQIGSFTLKGIENPGQMRVINESELDDFRRVYF